MGRSDKKAGDKTNVMRLLDQAGIPYVPYFYDPALTSGTAAAEALGLPEGSLFKTLVTVSDKGEHFVFVIPAGRSLSLKKAAKAAGVKAVAMLRQKDLLPLTGYVHGGCSPVGMKKPFPTFFDRSALTADAFYCSAGRVGAQIQVDPEALRTYVNGTFADLTGD